jgi:HlyD family secretion protein
MRFKKKIVYQSLICISIFMLASGWSMGFSNSLQYISKESVIIAQVQTGDFSIRVDGYGSLQSLNQRLLTATSNSLVDEIKLKAGAFVEADTVIMVLKNPGVEAELRQAFAKLQNSKTLKRQAILEQQREILNNESDFYKLESETEIALLQVRAERTLAKSGIVSGVNARRNELRASQLVKQVELEQVKLEKIAAVHREGLLIQDDFINQAQDELNVVKQMMEDLSVKAGIKGIIQRSSLKLGQRVVPGDELALIGSLFPLVAEIKIPQLQAHMVNEGMMAEINAIKGQIRGKVVRIDPVVNEGAVQVDIQLDEELYGGIKPMQLVDATILTEVKKGANYIKIPMGINENSTVFLFKLNEENIANRVEVKFGKYSNQFIQVLSGLKAGDRIIISKLNLDDETTQIKLGS